MPHPFYFILGVEVCIGFLAGGILGPIGGAQAGWRAFLLLNVGVVALAGAVGLLVYGLGVN